MGGSTPPTLFFQLKELFHILETLGSARIEGNRTTIAELVERKLDNPAEDEKPHEIRNIDTALIFIEETWSRDPENFRIDHRLIRELHRLTTSGLSVGAEGDATPGCYRAGQVRIARSAHQPPDAADVFPFMDELLNYLNNPDPPKYDLLKIALAHHSFTWIHPFSNGNGRTVRLFTYALLLKTGFRVGGPRPATRLLNPTAIFCSDRDKYYDMLSRADTGTDEGLLSWCSYVLSGLKVELDKVARLLDYDWLKKNILVPAIVELHRKNGLSSHERTVLLLTLDKVVIRNQDIRPSLNSISMVQASRILAELRKRRLLVPASGAERSYELGISQSPLLRTVLRQLDRQGFLPLKGEI
ncbi:MAG: Fic family protein [Spirochaetes bacterium]|nr:Fic family protein [Spirochaetota bacterium]